MRALDERARAVPAAVEASELAQMDCQPAAGGAYTCSMHVCPRRHASTSSAAGMDPGGLAIYGLAVYGLAVELSAGAQKGESAYAQGA